jgi:predicted protein tyrosine phosphatase
MIYVCSLLEMPGHVEALGPSHLVSLVAPVEQPPTPAGIVAERHLRVEVHDISQPLDGHILPERQHVARVIDFVRAWPADDGPLLVHCVAGISRSMAAALIGLVVKAGGRELEGRLIAAREAMGPAELTLPTPLARIPLLD